MKHKQDGFGAVGIIVIVLVVAIVGVLGWYLFHGKKAAPTSTVSTSTNPDAKLYAGWTTAKSDRALFTIKYPSTWKYTAMVGAKDNVEHIILDSPTMGIVIDSYLGSDAKNGGTAGTTCTDCKQTITSTPFTAGKLGQIKLETIKYDLDGKLGNALVLRQLDGTYFLPSPDAIAVKSTFRAVSKLPTVDAYQNETVAQFTSQQDFSTAKLILESISY